MQPDYNWSYDGPWPEIAYQLAHGYPIKPGKKKRAAIRHWLQGTMPKSLPVDHENDLEELRHFGYTQYRKGRVIRGPQVLKLRRVARAQWYVGEFGPWPNRHAALAWIGEYESLKKLNIRVVKS